MEKTSNQYAPNGHLNNIGKFSNNDSDSKSTESIDIITTNCPVEFDILTARDSSKTSDNLQMGKYSDNLTFTMKVTSNEVNLIYLPTNE